jgi:hypothetical protein
MEADGNPHQFSRSPWVQTKYFVARIGDSRDPKTAKSDEELTAQNWLP